MPTIKQVVDTATANALAQGAFGKFDDRSNEMQAYILAKVIENEFTEDDAEEYLGCSIEEHSDQQLDMIWPRDAGQA